jgi:hypothetical protein
MARPADFLRRLHTNLIPQIDRANGAFIPTSRNQCINDTNRKSDHKNLLPLGNKFLSPVFSIEFCVDLEHPNACFIR